MSLSSSIKGVVKRGNVAKLVRFFMGDDNEDDSAKTPSNENVKPARRKGEQTEESERDKEISGIMKDGFDQLKEDLKGDGEDGKVLVVMAFGPSRSGKSTLLNFLTVKNYPCLPDSGRINEKCMGKSIFEVGGGDESCTRDFRYYKLKASRFRAIHKLPPMPEGCEDYDILFIDSEGFGNSGDGASKGLFLGLFTLMGISNVQLFMHTDPMLNDGRLRCIAQNIVSTRILGSEQPKTVSIALGTPKEKQAPVKKEIFLDDSSDSDSDSDEDIEEIKKKCIEDNNEMYEDFNDRDKKNKPLFITKLKESAFVEDESKIEILTMPRCIQYNKEAYKRTLKDLSALILDGANPRKGSELCDAFDKTFKQVYEKCGLIEGQVSIDSVYSKIMTNLFDTITTKEKDTIKDFKASVADKNLEDIESILTSGPRNPEVLRFVKRPYELLAEEIGKYVPQSGLDAFSVSLLGKIKKESEERMIKDAFNILNLMKVWKDNNSMIHKLYEVNKSLRDAKEGDVVKINLIDKDGNETKESVNVKVLKDSFGYKNAKERKEDNIHFIFPVGIKITKITSSESTKKHFWKENDPVVKTNETDDITEGYHFDFISMRAFPITKDKYRKCSYKFLDYKGIFKYINIFSVTKTVEKTSIIVSLDDKCDFLIKNCEVIDYDNVQLGDRKTDDKGIREPKTSKKEVVIEAKPHKKHDKSNETKITFINFDFKPKTELVVHTKKTPQPLFPPVVKTRKVKI